jgi:hypothetical protein
MPAIFALWHYIRHCRDVMAEPQPSDLALPWLPLADISPQVYSHLKIADGAGWDGRAVQRHMEACMLDFVRHIPFEGQTSSDENLRKAAPAEVGKLTADLKMRVLKTVNFYTYVPMIWGTLDDPVAAAEALTRRSSVQAGDQ